MGTVPDFMRTGGFRRVGYEPDAWINEPGAWPIASTVWTANIAAAASKDYRILATPR